MRISAGIRAASLVLFFVFALGAPLGAQIQNSDLKELPIKLKAELAHPVRDPIVSIQDSVILVGSSNGKVQIYDTSSHKVKFTVQIPVGKNEVLKKIVSVGDGDALISLFDVDKTLFRVLLFHSKTRQFESLKQVTQNEYVNQMFWNHDAIRLQNEVVFYSKGSGRGMIYLNIYDIKAKKFRQNIIRVFGNGNQVAVKKSVDSFLLIHANRTGDELRIYSYKEGRLASLYTSISFASKSISCNKGNKVLEGFEDYQFFPLQIVNVGQKLLLFSDNPSPLELDTENCEIRHLEMRAICKVGEMSPLALSDYRVIPHEYGFYLLGGSRVIVSEGRISSNPICDVLNTYDTSTASYRPIGLISADLLGAKVFEDEEKIYWLTSQKIYQWSEK